MQSCPDGEPLNCSTHSVVQSVNHQHSAVATSFRYGMMQCFFQSLTSFQEKSELEFLIGDLVGELDRSERRRTEFIKQHHMCGMAMQKMTKNAYWISYIRSGNSLIN